MPNRLIAILLLICSTSYVQLSARNNAYVFINDEIVFVKNNINLNESNSKIYLRNEAQVILGSGTTGNSGVGELSVYRKQMLMNTIIIIGIRLLVAKLIIQ